MAKSIIAQVVGVATEVARGPVDGDRQAGSAPDPASVFAAPATYLVAGKTVRSFLVGYDRVGDPERVIGGVD